LTVTPYFLTGESEQPRLAGGVDDAAADLIAGFGLGPPVCSSEV
jgi:hypothetical protein